MKHCSAFLNHELFASGPPAQVAVAVRRALDQDASRTILMFDDSTGSVVDFDLRGSEADIAARLEPEAAQPGDEPLKPRSAGRPKLGVTGREVTLLPRHWDWLASQPGGASVTLRKLVDAARIANRGRDAARQAQAACDRFMQTMLGDAPGYEEASRALFNGDAAAFEARTEPWPVDLRDHARRLAAPAFSTAPTAEVAAPSP